MMLKELEGGGRGEADGREGMESLLWKDGMKQKVYPGNSIIINKYKDVNRHFHQILKGTF